MNDATPDPTPTPKDQRKQQLIDATIRCISEYGLSNTTVARVASAARLSDGIVNFYFTSKQLLLLETLRALSREYVETMALAFEFSEPDGGPAEILSEIIRAHFDPQICTAQKVAVWYAFSGESRARRDYLTICRQHDTHFQRSLLAVVTRLCRQTGNHCNPQAVSRGLVGLLDGYWQELLFRPSDFDPAAAIVTCEDYLAAFFPESGGGSVETQKRRNGKAATRANENTNTNAETSDLLPPWTYRNEEFFTLEIDRLFKKNWQVAGHLSDLPNPRDYLTFDAFDERALLVRGDDGRVRAFHNICRHRGAKLLDGERGHCDHALTCPLHDWTYALDGRLTGAPHRETFADFDMAEHCLTPLEMEIWMGFIFLRFRAPAPAAGAPSVAKVMQPVEALVAPYRMDELQPVADTKFDEMRRYNWKTFHDIDNEGYHVPLGHPALMQLYGQNYRDDAIGDVAVSYGYLNSRPGKMWSVRMYQKLLPDFPHLPEEQRRLWLYVGFFPNAVFALYPDSMEYYATIPLSTGKTRVHGAAYQLPGATPDLHRQANAVRYLGRRINRVTAREDGDFVRRLHEGMQSSAFPAPFLSSREQGVRRFHKQIQRALPVANLATAPVPGDSVVQINRNMAEAGV